MERISQQLLIALLSFIPIYSYSMEQTRIKQPATPVTLNQTIQSSFSKADVIKNTIKLFENFGANLAFDYINSHSKNYALSLPFFDITQDLETLTQEELENLASLFTIQKRFCDATFFEEEHYQTYKQDIEKLEKIQPFNLDEKTIIIAYQYGIDVYKLVFTYTIELKPAIELRHIIYPYKLKLLNQRFTSQDRLLMIQDLEEASVNFGKTFCQKVDEKTALQKEIVLAQLKRLDECAQRNPQIKQTAKFKSSLKLCQNILRSFEEKVETEIICELYETLSSTPIFVEVRKTKDQKEPTRIEKAPSPSAVILKASLTSKECIKKQAQCTSHDFLIADMHKLETIKTPINKNIAKFYQKYAALFNKELQQRKTLKRSLSHPQEQPTLDKSLKKPSSEAIAKSRTPLLVPKSLKTLSPKEEDPLIETPSLEEVQLLSSCSYAPTRDDLEPDSGDWLVKKSLCLNSPKILKALAYIHDHIGPMEYTISLYNIIPYLDPVKIKKNTHTPWFYPSLNIENGDDCTYGVTEVYGDQVPCYKTINEKSCERSDIFHQFSPCVNNYIDIFGCNENFIQVGREKIKEKLIRTSILGTIEYKGKIVPGLFQYIYRQDNPYFVFHRCFKPLAHLNCETLELIKSLITFCEQNQTNKKFWQAHLATLRAKIAQIETTTLTN